MLWTMGVSQANMFIWVLAPFGNPERAGYDFDEFPGTSLKYRDRQRGACWPGMCRVAGRFLHT